MWHGDCDPKGVGYSQVKGSRSPCLFALPYRTSHSKDLGQEIFPTSGIEKLQVSL